MMDKKTLRDIFSQNLFKIPDYQRGYAWETKQLNDFVEDIDALVNEDLKSHYTGTVVTYQDKHKPPVDYGSTDRLEVVDVVDGQQRLTTCCLYLSVIIRALIDKGESDYAQKIPLFLYAGTTCKVTLNNDTSDFFYDLLKNGYPNTELNSTHEQRLLDACKYLQEHIQNQLVDRDGDGVRYIKDLYDAIIRKLTFTVYTIEEECEIGMTFELMNSRGKELSVLELLKNYFMHWVSRNENDEMERNSLTSLINKNWKDTYTNIGSGAGNEDQCLRIAWTLYCSHTPRNWKGYDGFKQDSYIPLRNFNIKSKEDTKQFLEDFSNGLADISRHYARIVSPTAGNTLSNNEYILLKKIHHTGNIANFLPLMVAARMNFENQKISDSEYYDLLEVLERYAYRVFLFEGKRSNAGMSNFYRWGSEIFRQEFSIQNVIKWINELINYYASEESFIEKVSKSMNWYSRRNLLRYTLFEYELHLLASEGKDKEPHLRWENLSDSTIEHIFPQTPDENSNWKQIWSEESIKTYLHDIGNLVLTQNNSNYLNFDFTRKKGKPGISPSYSNSDIRQERKIASFDNWHPDDLKKRRTEISDWIIQHWKTPDHQDLADEEIEVQEDMDEDGNIQSTVWGCNSE
jgi:Uncharacterized conserved protein